MEKKRLAGLKTIYIQTNILLLQYSITRLCNSVGKSATFPQNIRFERCYLKLRYIIAYNLYAIFKLYISFSFHIGGLESKIIMPEFFSVTYLQECVGSVTISCDKFGWSVCSFRNRKWEKKKLLQISTVGITTIKSYNFSTALTVGYLTNFRVWDRAHYACRQHLPK